MTICPFKLRLSSCGAGGSSSTRVMKSSKSQQNFTSTACNLSDYLENEHVEGGARVVLSSGGNARKQIYLAGDSVVKRKYEDMTSCRIEDVEAEIHHEESGKFSYFREHKKRRPPEAGNPMQFQESSTTPVQVEGVQREVDELQVRSSKISRRSCSVSGVEVTPDICGESDLTAENQMAEESSRSSNNDGSSMFESAAESVSKGPNTEFRSVSSQGVIHCFMERTHGGREVSVVTSSEGPGQISNLLLRNDAHNTTMKDANDGREGVRKSEPAASYRLGSGSSEAPSSAKNYTVPSQRWGRNNQEWLQLGVGTSSGRGTPATSNVHLDRASGEEGQPSTLGQDLREERSIFKRRITTSIDFPVAADCEAYTNYIFPEHLNASPGEWQFGRVSNGIPPKLEVCPSDLSGNLNPATLRSIPISSVMRNSNAASEAVEAVQPPDLGFFDRRLVQRGTARQELVLAPLSCLGTAESENERAMVSIDNAFELRRDQEGSQAGAFPDHRGDRFGSGCLRGPDIHNRAGPLSISTPITDVHLRSAAAGAAAGPSMGRDTFQCHSDNPPCSLSDLQQRSEDLRHGQIGYSWLPTPAADSAPKLIPTANNFQGWISSESASTTKLTAALSPGNNARMENPPNQQATRGLDEWGNLFKKVSPRMLFQSQCHDLSSEGSPVLVQSAGHETNVGSQENLVALKREIENIQKGPQWPIPPETMNVSIASWCFNGNLQGVRGESKLECFAGERMPSESGAAQSRFADDHLNLSEKPPQRQSWQPAGGQTKLHHVNVTALHRPAPETAGKPRSQMLPPGSRGTNHAGLWFVLQSAENQSTEGGLPQISKAYLRIKDGKMPVSAVKKYLVTKLGLTSESEVEITCKGQPVVPSLPLQHVRDVIWFSSLNANNNKKEQASYGERGESTTSASEQRSHLHPVTDRAATAAGASTFSKDILMVLTYRRHPRSLQLSTLVT